MKSKIELRLEAARIASKLEGVNIENFCESVSVVEMYLSGCTHLPEVYDETDKITNMVKEMVNNLEKRQTCTPPRFDSYRNAVGPSEDTVLGSCLGIGDPKALEMMSEFYRKHPEAAGGICEAKPLYPPK